MKVWNLVNAGAVLIGTLWAWLYYTGRLNWQGEKELRRRERVRKFGWLFVTSMILGVIFSLGLIVDIF